MYTYKGNPRGLNEQVLNLKIITFFRLKKKSRREKKT